MVDAPTSDGEPRPNDVEPRSPIVVTIPTSIGANARVGVLNQLATAVGIGTTGLAITAAYSDVYVCQRINDISTKVNSLAGSSVLPLYTSVDYNAFTSIVSNIAAKMAALP